MRACHVGMLLSVALAVEFVVDYADQEPLVDFNVNALGDIVLATAGFGLYQGGKVRVNLTWSGMEPFRPISIALMNQAQYSKAVATDKRIGELSSYDASICQLPSLYRTQIHINHRNPFNLELTAPELDRYHVVVANCDEHNMRIKGSITFTNPGGEHVSVENIPLQTIYGLQFAFSLGLCIAMIGYIYFNSITLRVAHWLFSGGLLLQAIHSLLILCYFADQSSTGKVRTAFLITILVIGDLVELYLLVLGVLFGGGVFINRSDTFHSEKRLIAVLAAVFVLSFLILRTGSCSTVTVCSSLLVFRYAVTFFFLFYMILNVNISLVRLREQTIAAMPATASLTKLFGSKLTTYNTLRTSYALFLVSVPILLSLGAAVNWYSGWVTDVLRALAVDALELSIVGLLLASDDSRLFDYID